MKEFGDKIGAAEKSRIEDAIAKLKSVMGADDLEASKRPRKSLPQPLISSPKPCTPRLPNSRRARAARRPGGSTGRRTGRGQPEER